jgi:hypothetical protein
VDASATAVVEQGQAGDEILFDVVPVLEGPVSGGAEAQLGERGTVAPPSPAIAASFARLASPATVTVLAAVFVTITKACGSRAFSARRASIVCCTSAGDRPAAGTRPA